MTLKKGIILTRIAMSFRWQILSQEPSHILAHHFSECCLIHARPQKRIGNCGEFRGVELHGDGPVIIRAKRNRIRAEEFHRIDNGGGDTIWRNIANHAAEISNADNPFARGNLL